MDVSLNPTDQASASMSNSSIDSSANESHGLLVNAASGVDKGSVQFNASTGSRNTITYKDLVFLHKAYEPKYWYWEIVETMRRLFFTALLVIATTSANLQVCSAFDLMCGGECTSFVI